MKRTAVMVAIVMIVSMVGNAVPPSEIFEDGFEYGDTCDWDVTVPQPCTFCADANTAALWHFDGGAGQVVADSSGWGRHLSLGPTSAVETDDPAWSAGRFGGGLSFDSSTLQYATGTHNVTFASNQLTVELWVRPTGGSGTWGDGQIFTAGFINCQMVTSTGDNTVYVAVGDGSSWNGMVVDAGVVDLDDGSWHYLVMTYDGTTLAAYIDGELADSQPALITLAHPQDLKVGGRPQNDFLDGWMDEVRLSTIARPPGEIAANWSAAQSCEVRSD